MERSIRGVIKSVVGSAGYRLVRRKGDYSGYLDFHDTMNLALKSGLSVGDFIENRSKVPFSTEQTLQKMAEAGVFDGRIERVSEIGPGSGRYLERTLQRCNPAYYEIYETASDWAKWLAGKYHVTSQACGGTSLDSTPSSSIDLVQAHKVFPGLPFFSVVRYFAEMARVARNGGKVVFDICSEDCMDDETLAKWLAPEVAIDSWDLTVTVFPRRYAIDYFLRKGFLLRGSFFIDLWPGKTEYLVFSK